MTTAHLKQLGTVFRPGPDLGDLAWRRRHFDQRDFSICGITHTVSETMAMQVIGNLMVAPVQPWDALVCTTKCVKGVVERLLTDWADYLGARFEHDVQLPCQLPVIPLGVDSTEMAAKAVRHMKSCEKTSQHHVFVMCQGPSGYMAKHTRWTDQN